MNIGLEQLIWAIVILIFIVASALKNLRKKRPGAKPIPTQEPSKGRPKSDDDLRRFLEELMGIERPKEEPPIRHETEEAAPPVILKRPKKKPETKIIKKEPVEVTRSKLVQLAGLKTQPLAEASKALEHPVAPPKPVVTLSVAKGNLNDLKRAIILSEIIGPPLAKRKTHRLF